MRMRTAVMIAGLLLAASVLPALAQDENTWGYDKGFFFHTPRFELKISTRTQFRYTYTMTDPNSLTDDNGFFNLPRTRLRLDGYAYYTWLKYKVQYDFTGQDDAGATPPRRSPDLRDLYFDLARNPRATVRLGQFKAPLGIQELTSSGEQEFVDRSIASERFAPSRQEGAMLWGTTFAKKFGYESGAFNGNARNHNANDNTGYMYVARVHFDPNGEYKLSEAAVDNPDKPNWTIGVAYMLNTTEQSLLKTAEHLQQTTGEGFEEPLVLEAEEAFTCSRRREKASSASSTRGSSSSRTTTRGRRNRRPAPPTSTPTAPSGRSVSSWCRARSKSPCVTAPSIPIRTSTTTSRPRSVSASATTSASTSSSSSRTM